MSENTEKHDNKEKIVSYSQFSNWYKCPHRWYLDKVKGLQIRDENINTCFGTAIHECLQSYVETLYKKNVHEAESLDLHKQFKETFDKELTEKKVEKTDEDYNNYLEDGNHILRSFLHSTNRTKNFPTGRYEFLGVEIDLTTPVKNTVSFWGFIDLVLKDKETDRIKIYDFKTSSTGWNQYMKEDFSKIAQILLYKAFFSKKFDVPMELIDVEFFIVKRKLFEKAAYPQSRIQLFSPTSSTKSVTSAVQKFVSFLDTCFTSDGKYKTDEKLYPKISGKYKKNCKYCPHYKKNCDGKDTPTENSEQENDIWEQVS